MKNFIFRSVWSGCSRMGGIGLIYILYIIYMIIYIYLPVKEKKRKILDSRSGTT